MPRVLPVLRMTPDAVAQILGRVPTPHMREGIQRYLLFGEYDPGSFLGLLLEDKFRYAAMKADPQNAMAMQKWARFLVNFMPRESWGSRIRVALWCAARKHPHA